MGAVTIGCFEALVVEHHAEIYGYLLRITGKPSDADDLCQETFLRAFRAHASLKPTHHPRAWLFAIATNLSRNHFRTMKRRRNAHERLALEPATPTPPADGASADRELALVVEATIARLPLKQRLAFVQRKLHGQDYDAIGESLGCSAESARANVFQAMKKLKRALDGRERRAEHEPA